MPPILEEVLVEDLLGGIVVVQHFAVEGGGLLGGNIQLHNLDKKMR